MRIACTECNAVYELPPERVRPGRGVKCARCGTVWVPVELEDVAPEIPSVDKVSPEPEPVSPEPVSPEPAVPLTETVVAEPAAIEAPAAAVLPAPERRQSRAPVVLAWVLSLAVLAALGWAAVAYRSTVVQAWPPAARAYKLLGLAELPRQDPAVP